MEAYDIYKDVQQRTNGDIYLGIVGPVRTGKSTFITAFANNLLLPQITDNNVKQRMIDELPQSANGNTIMTTQPKFVPNEAVAVKVGGNVDVKVRLVDCVGYVVKGASGCEEGGKDRLVSTPWQSEPMPFTLAAEIGTKKVINEHATVGIVMTTDGSIDTGLSRNSYEEVEEKVINELKAIKKPFVIILNTTHPQSAETVNLASSLTQKYSTSVLPVDVKNMNNDDVSRIFESILLEFPLRRIDVDFAPFIKALDKDSEVFERIVNIAKEKSETMSKMSHYLNFSSEINDDYFDSIDVTSCSLGEGKMNLYITEKPDLFYKTLSAQCGVDIVDEFTLVQTVKEFACAKKCYDKISTAMLSAQETGYGVVKPGVSDVEFDEPRIEKKGSHYGVKLRASAPSYHIVKVDVHTEVSPLMGAQMQSEESVKQLMSQLDSSADGIWKSNMFGRSIEDVVSDNLTTKTSSMQDETKKKMRRAITRIVNEGKGGVICILL